MLQWSTLCLWGLKTPSSFKDNGINRPIILLSIILDQHWALRLVFWNKHKLYQPLSVESLQLVNSQTFSITILLWNDWNNILLDFWKCTLSCKNTAVIHRTWLSSHLGTCEARARKDGFQRVDWGGGMDQIWSNGMLQTSWFQHPSPDFDSTDSQHPSFEFHF